MPNRQRCGVEPPNNKENKESPIEMYAPMFDAFEPLGLLNRVHLAICNAFTVDFDNFTKFTRADFLNLVKVTLKPARLLVLRKRI